MLIVDSHVHIWQLDQPRMEWLTADETLHRLHRDVLVEDLQAQLDANDVPFAVLVQAATDSRETATLLRLADHTPSVLGVVGWAPMTSEAATRQALDGWPEPSLLCGIRHLHGWQPDGSVLADGGALDSAGVLAERGLVLDVHMSDPAVAGEVVRIATAFPTLSIVVNHLAHPQLLEPSRCGEWRAAIDVMAEHPRVVVKCSGWATRLPSPDPALVRPYVEHVVRAFGPRRIMVASNWPVATASGATYAQTLRATLDALALSGENLRQVLSGTAARVYGLDLPPGDDGVTRDAARPPRSG
ncbi:amidohydrolase family protein [Pseudonocardia ailaonensis]|uniref:Amidohydrolase family protein n=1 Tax=Pseudonocardia ailaonensis TaxID=367279 RepID=A0ABN2N5P6_9PSEU